MAQGHCTPSSPEVAEIGSCPGMIHAGAFFISEPGHPKRREPGLARRVRPPFRDRHLVGEPTGSPRPAPLSSSSRKPSVLYRYSGAAQSRPRRSVDRRGAQNTVDPERTAEVNWCPAVTAGARAMDSRALSWVVHMESASQPSSQHGHRWPPGHPSHLTALGRDRKISRL